MLKNIILKNIDCLKAFKAIPDQSIDLVLADPPYAITDCHWDSLIPLDEMWDHLNRIIKPNRAILLCASQPFTSELVVSNKKGFKYVWTWDKVYPSGPGYAKYRPMQQTEDVVVFSKNGKKVLYNPQMIKRDKPIKSGGNSTTSVYGGFKNFGDKKYNKVYEYKNPTTLITFKKVRRGTIHPTQKPVELMEYMIKTFSNEGDVVLDFCMGSGTTGVASLNLNRRFIGFEKDKEIFDKAKDRIEGSVK